MGGIRDTVGAVPPQAASSGGKAEKESEGCLVVPAVFKTVGRPLQV
jgi:peptide deformylase